MTHAVLLHTHRATCFCAVSCRTPYSDHFGKRGVGIVFDLDSAATFDHALCYFPASSAPLTARSTS